MDTRISRRVHAESQTVFALAAAVEDWPRILPHYRWVRLLSDNGAGRRTVEMAARRDVVGRLGFPLHWVAVETALSAERRIDFTHVRGVTRGMRVTWTIAQDSATSTVVVQIRHVFNPAWPVPDSIVNHIVGEYFVNGVARRTLRLIGELAESRTKDA